MLKKIIKIKDLPKELLDTLWEQIMPYSIGLVGVTETQSGEDVSLIGSGTLIQVGSIKGILTAQHVVVSKRYKAAKSLGIVFLTHIHRFTLEKEYLHIIEIARPREPSKGPDLAVIVLPEAKIQWVEAYRQFWNISSRRDEVLSNPLDVNLGLWYVSGFPDEFTRIEEPQSGFNKARGFCNLFGWTGIEREWFDGEYDYLDLPVLYEDSNTLPSSFGGVSGGGIWQIPLQERGDGVIVSKDPVFSGVAFYQTDVVDLKRTIRGHGRRSIYEAVCGAIT